MDTHKQHYRPEIQGLRAVAALLVAVYHIWLGRVSGGVDVFFVVSGFLITRSLLGQLEQHGRLDPATFWSGLSRRLLPAALLVLAVVVVASLLWLPRIRWFATIKEVVASALYFQNWHLAFKNIDYLERGDFMSPVQHYWALSLQGQIYLLWPILLSLAVWAGRRAGLDVRRSVALVLGVVVVASLSYSIVATRIDQPFAYFNTFTRIWQISIGGLLALNPTRWNLSRPGRVALGWVGLLAILSCGLLLPVSRVFPGYAALWPTLAGAAIIIAGRSGSPLGADRLLSIRPLTALGDVSYSIYLWHWPLFIFYRIVTGTTDIGLLPGIILVALTIVLAVLTTRYVESPIRHAPHRTDSPLRTLGKGALAVAAVLGLAVGWGLLYLQAKRADLQVIADDDPRYPGARALDPDFAAPIPNVRPYPGPLAVRNDLAAVYADGCQQVYEQDSVLSCVYGDATARHTIALVGGSHSTHWLPALEPIARAHGWRIVTYLKDLCRFGLAPGRAYGKPYPSCDRWKSAVAQRLLADPPDVVFTTATYAGDGPETVPAGFVEAWRRLGEAGVAVIAVRDTPFMGFQVAECVELHGVTAVECTRPRAAVLATRNPAERISLPSNVHVLDLSRYFCDAATCGPIVGNVMIYRDRTHITATYMRSLAPALQRAMTEATVLPEPMRAQLAASLH